MNYNKITRYCDKYNIKRYTDLGVPLTYNKLKHRVDQFENKKHKLSRKQQIHNNILKYLEGEIGENELNNAIYHYIGI
jgi:response regulator of citrate/malate metabolism